MRRTFPIFFFLSFLLIALSCKKEKLPGSGGETVGTPEFSLDNMIDGVMGTFAAGMEDYYMFTEYELDEDSIFVFSGTLKKEDCETDCGSELRVEFRDVQKGVVNSGFRIDKAIRCGFYSFKDANSQYVFGGREPFVSNNIYKVNLFGETNATGAVSYDWIYEDDIERGMVKGIKDPVIIFTALPPGKNSIFGLTVEDEDGNKCYREHTSIIGRGYELCYADFEGELMSNGKIKLSAVVEGGLEPFNFMWSTGETTPSIEVDSEEGEYELSILSGTDRCTNLIRKTVKLEGNTVKTISCSFTWDDDNNTWKKFRFESGMRFHFGTVAMIYKDENGKEFRSDTDEQAESNFFEVLSVEPFENNENGEKTIKLEIKYLADVFDENGNKKTIEGEGRIAVAHP